MFKQNILKHNLFTDILIRSKYTCPSEMSENHMICYFWNGMMISGSQTSFLRQLIWHWCIRCWMNVLKKMVISIPLSCLYITALLLSFHSCGSQLRVILPPGNIWQYLNTFLMDRSTTEGSNDWVLLALVGFKYTSVSALHNKCELQASYKYWFNLQKCVKVNTV